MGISAGGIGLATQTAGAVVGAVGSYNQASRQQSTLNYEAAIAGNNAQIADFQAKQENLIGQQQEQTSRLKTADVFSSQRANLAANGVDLGVGSASDILTSTEYLGERDALTIRDNAARRQWAYQTNAQNYRSNVGADLASADAINPTFSAVGSLLSGATPVAKTLYGKNGVKF